MSRAPRLIVETFPTPTIRRFHVNAALTAERGQGEDYFRLIDQLRAVDGVTTAEVERYTAKVYIGRAFEWDDVQPLVIAVLSERLGWHPEEVDPEQVHTDLSREAAQDVGAAQSVAADTIGSI